MEANILLLWINGSWKHGVLFGNKDLRTVSNELVIHIDFVYVTCRCRQKNIAYIADEDGHVVVLGTLR